MPERAPTAIIPQDARTACHPRVHLRRPALDATAITRPPPIWQHARRALNPLGPDRRLSSREDTLHSAFCVVDHPEIRRHDRHDRLDLAHSAIRPRRTPSVSQAMGEAIEHCSRRHAKGDHLGSLDHTKVGARRPNTTRRPRTQTAPIRVR